MHRLLRPEVRALCRGIWAVAWVAVAVLLLMPVPVRAPEGSDLVAHALLFGGLAFAAVTFCHEPRRLALLSLLTLTGALLLEGAQALLPWRSFDAADMLADGLGVTAGYGGALLVLRLLIRRADPRLEGARL